MEPGAAEVPAADAHETELLTTGDIDAVELLNSVNRLYELFASGALSGEEFQSLKRRLLSTTTPSFGRFESPDVFAPERRSRHGRSGDTVGSHNSRGSAARDVRRNSHHHSCTSSSSSSSSSSASSDFMIAPRAKVWRPLDEASDLESLALPGKMPAPPGGFGAVAGGKEQTRAANVSPSESPTSSVAMGLYGTFPMPWGVRMSGSKGSPKSSMRAPLRSSNDVHVEYFNCRGARGGRFGDVRLKKSELRPSYFLRRRHATHGLSSAFTTSQSELEFGGANTDDQGELQNVATLSNASCHSNLEVCFNWYWIDMVGRDASCSKYNSTLRYLTKKFHISESFLIDRDHLLVLPQICTSPEFPFQFLICLRVATPQIALDDDSVQELTNRWIIVVDLKQKFVITIHRVDAVSMANMRQQWTSLMEENDISFQEFLFKLLVDAVGTYKSSLDVHADLLDLCESKLFVSGSGGMKNEPCQEEKGDERRSHISNERILAHFAKSSRSPFFQYLLSKNTKPMDKGIANTFLYHLQRRTNVQYRVLSITQTVLTQSFTKLRLCSKEHANQMCAQCIELIDRALEVRDEAKTLLHMHISLQSFRSNELMAVLTKFSVFFTPCSFLATVYGMNFPHIPEFYLPHGYALYWIACLGMCFFTYMYMRSRDLLQ